MKTQTADPVLPDEEIIQLYWDRDESAIRQTDRKYRNYLYAIAWNLLSDHQDSEECLNDTYFKTWNTIPPTQPKIFLSFLSKIMRNTALDRYDAATRQKRIPAELCDPVESFEGVLSDSPSLEDIMAAKRIGHLISEYLDTVSDKQLYIFLSRYYFFVPTAQIAQTLHLSVSSVHKQLSAMKQALRAHLLQGGVDL